MYHYSSLRDYLHKIRQNDANYKWTIKKIPTGDFQLGLFIKNVINYDLIKFGLTFLIASSNSLTKLFINSFTGIILSMRQALAPAKLNPLLNFPHLAWSRASAMQ